MVTKPFTNAVDTTVTMLEKLKHSVMHAIVLNSKASLGTFAHMRDRMLESERIGEETATCKL